MEGTRREADLAGIGGCRVQRGPSTDRERVLGKTKSTASDDEREEKALKDRERERVWAAATTLREKYVNFVVPRTFTEKEMGMAYQTTAAYLWQEGKVGEKHRAFLMSCDLLHESGEGTSVGKGARVEG